MTNQPEPNADSRLTRQAPFSLGTMRCLDAVPSHDRDRRTALHYASLEGQLSAVEQLVRERADVNAQDRQGFTPLHFAAQEYRLDVARALLGAGASTTIRNMHGNTALWTATVSSRGRGELIAELLAHGADPDSVNNSGVSPRKLAATIGNYDVAQFFDLWG